jgi:MFS family permease
MRQDMRSILASVFYLLCSFSVLTLCIGLNSTLLGVRATIEHFSPLTIGLMMSSYYSGFIVGSHFIEKLIHRVGHIRTFCAIGATLSIVTLLYICWIHPVPWILLRFFHGVLISGGYMVIESWLNGLASKENRGRIMSIYLILNSLGLACGQLFFKLSDGSGFILFATSSMLASLCVLPLILSNTKQPEYTGSVDLLPFKTLFKLSPLAVIGALCMGLVNGAFFGLCAPTLLHQHLSASDVSQFIAAAFLGGLFLQWPLGSLSDRINRRVVLFISALLAAASAFAVSQLTLNASDHYHLLLLCGLLYGGFCFPIYSLLIALANDRLEAGMYVRASRALLSLNGLGAIIGPLVASAIVQSFGDAGLFAYIALVFFTLSMISLTRMIFGPKLPRKTLTH